MSWNYNLKEIHENAFGFLNNSDDRTETISMIEISYGGLESIPKKLLPWDSIKISIIANPVNCGRNADWLFRNKKYQIDTDGVNNEFLREWCKSLF